MQIKCSQYLTGNSIYLVFTCLEQGLLIKGKKMSYYRNSLKIQKENHLATMRPWFSNYLVSCNLL